jgi:hypothetical protein
VSSDGKRCGVGMLKNSDGTVYLGKWKNNLFYDKGVYIYPDGQRY